MYPALCYDAGMSSVGILLLESALLYLVPPLLLLTGVLPKYLVLPLLWAGTLYALFVLRRNGAALHWHVELSDLWRIFRRFALLGAALLLAVWLCAPERFFAMPLHRPGLWAAVILLYPLLSALAQEILFRAFFAYRFEHLLGTRPLLLFNAAVFAAVHAVFGNPLAVMLSFLGGLVFMSTYLKTRSVSTSTIEHALYGDLVFTVGLGAYFYHGQL